jgi:hypothetical protein
MYIFSYYKEVIMGKIEVVNIKGMVKGSYEYIGRGSVLGNKYIIGNDGSREEVIRLYKKWLWGEMFDGGEVFREIKRLVFKYYESDVVLGCFCKPKACHGDVVKACVIWGSKELGL